MRIGDKVRLLRGTEEGFIVSIKGNIVEIEIEDGFVIPTVKNEVVIIDKKEAENFNRKQEEEDIEPEKIPSRQTSIDDGYYLGIDDFDNELDCYIINQSPSPLLFSVSIVEKKSIIGLSHGTCQPYDAADLGKTQMNAQKKSVQFHIQLILHQEETKAKKPPIDEVFVIQKHHLADKINVQLLDKAITLVNLEKIDEVEINTELLKDSLTGDAPQASTPRKEPLKIQKEQIIDLHLDLAKENLKENEALRHQLDMFETAFDQAILTNAEQLKVIHGIGSGKLRDEIHKRLSKRKEVNYFEDADKERFGFGSTIIYF